MFGAEKGSVDYSGTAAIMSRQDAMVKTGDADEKRVMW
jgi:hypothetical protein